MYLKGHGTFKVIRTNSRAAGASLRRPFYNIIYSTKNVVNVRKSYRNAVFISIFNELLWMFGAFSGMFHNKALGCQFSTDGMQRGPFPPLGGY